MPSRFKALSVAMALLFTTAVATESYAQKGSSSSRSSSSGSSSRSSGSSSSSSRSSGSSSSSRSSTPSSGSRFGGSTSGSSSKSSGSTVGGSRFGGSTSGGMSAAPSSGPKFGGSTSGSTGKSSATTGGSTASTPKFGGSSSGTVSTPKFGGSSSGPNSPASKSSGSSSGSSVPPPKFSGSAPKTNDVGSQAAKARAQQASSQAKAAAETPKVVKTASGKSYSIPPTVSSRVSPQAASTRNVRITHVYTTNHYGGWYSHPYQSDPFHPMLTGYLLGRLSQPVYYDHTRDWVYANYDTMDPIRREELFRENARLKDDIARMRANSVPVQQVSLDGVDPDVMYNDQAAEVLYTPVRPGPSAWTVLGWIAVIGLVVFLIWAYFNVKVTH